MEKADPIFLFLGLPAIPLGLIIAKLLRWEEALLKLWRRISTKLPFFGTTEGNLVELFIFSAGNTDMAVVIEWYFI